MVKAIYLRINILTTAAMGQIPRVTERIFVKTNLAGSNLQLSVGKVQLAVATTTTLHVTTNSNRLRRDDVMTAD